MAERITITLQTENSAFEEDAGREVARILRQLAKHFEEGTMPPHFLRDINGNEIGALTTEDL